MADILDTPNMLERAVLDAERSLRELKAPESLVSQPVTALARLETQHLELQQRQTLAAFELADGELEDVLAAIRADVQSDETPVAMVQ